jgi:hypothetical protein
MNLHQLTQALRDRTLIASKRFRDFTASLRGEWKLQVPPRILASGAPPQGDPLSGQRQFFGVEIDSVQFLDGGLAHAVYSRKRCQWRKGSELRRAVLVFHLGYVGGHDSL